MIPTDILIASEKENDLLELLLSTQNYNLVLNTTARETLNYLKTHTPTLIILDARLPDMSGLDICFRLKKITRLKNVPTILLVSSKDKHYLDEAKRSKADQIIIKPLAGKNIREIVAQHLGKQTLSDEYVEWRSAG